MAKSEKKAADVDEQPPRQQHLEGMEPPKNEAIERLALAYVSLRNERMQLLEKEIAKRDLLEAKMQEAGLTRYEFDGKTVEIDTETKVKVRSKKEEESTVEKGRKHLAGK